MDREGVHRFWKAKALWQLVKNASAVIEHMTQEAEAAGLTWSSVLEEKKKTVVASVLEGKREEIKAQMRKLVQEIREREKNKKWAPDNEDKLAAAKRVLAWLQESQEICPHNLT